MATGPIATSVKEMSLWASHNEYDSRAGKSVSVFRMLCIMNLIVVKHLNVPLFLPIANLALTLLFVDSQDLLLHSETEDCIFFQTKVEGIEIG